MAAVEIVETPNFFFTGFGQFAGVKDNPSQRLVLSITEDASCLQPGLQWQSEVLII